MNDLNKLTISVTFEGNQIKATCAELEVEAVGETMNEALKALQEAIDSFIAKNEKLHQNLFIRGLHGGDDSEGFDWWLEDTLNDLFRAKLLKAFCDNYPKVDRENPFAHLKIPSIDWDGGDDYGEWKAAQRNAYEGLIAEGKKNQAWVNFIQAVCSVKLKCFWKPQQPQIYQGWKDIGLPVLSFQKIMAMTYREIDTLITVPKLTASREKPVGKKRKDTRSRTAVSD